MAFGFKVRAEGEYALFSRPELKVERYSYDVITPSAARGLLEAVFWKPGMSYVIDKIHVVNPIKTANIRRNEVLDKISADKARSAMNGNQAPLYTVTKEQIQQRASLVLRDVCYVIEAHFEMTPNAGETDTPEKFYNMLLRRLRNGQHYHQPYLGCREFPARLSLYEGETVSSYYEKTEKDLGLMLYDMDYTNLQDIRPQFFRAVLKNGVLDLRNCEVLS